MFKNLSLVALLAFGSVSALAENEIKTPRAVSPTIKTSDVSAVNNYLKSLVEEYEGKTEASGDLTFYFDANKTPCKKTSSIKLVCNYDYNQDRWNGEVTAEFSVKGKNINKLTKIEFGGNF